MRLYLWFDTQAEAAARYYVDTFKACGRPAELGMTSYYGPESERQGQVLVVTFTLDGQQMMALNAGPQFAFSPAVSLVVECADQVELDAFWARLIEDGGEASRCGWLTDRFGLSWQITPAEWSTWMAGPSSAGRDRAMQAMMGMGKLDIAALKAAYDGVA